MTFLLITLVLASVKVWIEPQTVVLTPGDSTKITVEVESEGKVVKPASLELQVIPPRIGKIRNGWLIANTLGTGILRAVVKYKDKEFAGHAAVRVVPKRGRLHIQLDPSAVEVRPRGTVKFQYSVLDQRGLEVNVKPHFKVVPPWLGEIDDNGEFRAGDLPGEGKVVAWVETDTLRGLGQSRVKVLGFRGKPIRVIVKPKTIAISMKKSVKIDVDLIGVDETNVEKVFYLDPPNLGVVKDNVFHAGDEPGRGLLWVYVRSKEGRYGVARVPVFVGPRERLPHINAEPSQLYLFPGEVTEVRLKFKNIPPIMKKKAESKGGIHWQVKPKFLLRIVGPRTGPHIRVRAVKPGVGAVIAKIGQRVISVVPVVVGKEIVLSLSPASPKAGEVFKVSWKPNVDVSFRAFPPGVVEILGDGQFRALKPGRVLLFAIPFDYGGGGFKWVEIKE